MAAVGACSASSTTVSNTAQTAAASATSAPASSPPATSAPATSAPATTASASPTATAGSGLTLDAYNKLMVGMTEAQVTAITGPCETSSETNIAGSTSKTLDCEGNEPFSSAILLFSNGKLASKSQFGLSSSSSEVKGSMTLAKFNQLKIGQTAAAVQAITGPCEKSSETRIAGLESFTLTCYASDGIGNALLMFDGGKLESKARFGLR